MHKKTNRTPPAPGHLVNALLYILSFAVSAAGMLLIIKSRGFYPFKDTTMFVMDMRDQYVEFFASLRYLFTGENSLFFSWSRSMGGNYIGLFAYYIASPLSFITLFFPLKHMPLAVVVLSVLKIGLCGLSFSVYASYLWQHGRVSPSPGPWTRLAVLPLAAAYALMSYNIVYLLCLMWLDGVILLPCILLGAEKLLDGKRGLHYMLALTALFYCNYYTGYMAGIFTVLYVVFRTLTRFPRMPFKESLRRLLGFTATTLLSLGLSAPLLLPVARDLLTGRLAADTYAPGTPYSFQPFTRLFGQYANGVYQSLDSRGLPSIYCGYVVLAFIFLFFLLPRIPLREKASAFCILLILSLSFYHRKIDVMWHGFQSPVCFPFRYAFVFGFFLLYMAVRGAGCIPWEKLPSLWQRRPLFELIVAALMVFTARDMGVNGRDILFAIGNQFPYDSIQNYETFLVSTEPLIEGIKQNDDGLYRINQAYEYSKNDSLLLGYNGMTHYSSTFNKSVNTLTSKLGLAQIHFWNSGYGSNPLLDSLFSVKYVLDGRPVPEFYTKLEDTDIIWDENTQATASYCNGNALSMAYSAPAATLSPNLDSDDPFENQNNFLNSIAGTDAAYFTEYDCTTTQGISASDTGILAVVTQGFDSPGQNAATFGHDANSSEQDAVSEHGADSSDQDGNASEQDLPVSGPSDAGWTYTFTAGSSNPVYLYLLTDEYNPYTPAGVYVNGSPAGGYFTSETLCSLYLGSFNAGQQVIVEIPEQTMAPNAVLIGELHMELLLNTLSALKGGCMDVTSHRGGHLSGTITVSEGETILTSIPYDRGWTVKIDGKKAETEIFADTFLAIPTESGEHTIAFSYVSPGFGTGLFLCVMALALGGVYFLPHRRRPRGR